MEVDLRTSLNLLYGVDGGTWTPTDLSTCTSSMHVYHSATSTKLFLTFLYLSINLIIITTLQIFLLYTMLWYIMVKNLTKVLLQIILNRFCRDFQKFSIQNAFVRNNIFFLKLTLMRKMLLRIIVVYKMNNMVLIRISMYSQRKYCLNLDAFRFGMRTIKT